MSEIIEGLTVIHFILIFVILALLMIRIKKRALFFPLPVLFSALLLSLSSFAFLLAYRSSMNQLTENTYTPIIPFAFFMDYSFWAIRIYVLVFVISIAFFYKRSLTLREVAEQQKLEKIQYELLDSSNKVLRAWKHDNVNHLQTISRLAENGQLEECRQYVNQLIEGIQFDTPSINTGNPTIDAILSVKKQEATEAGIDFTYELYLPQESYLPLNNMEFSSLIGNLMNNAIEASRKTKFPTIYLSIKPIQSNLLIEMKNSSTGNYRYNTSGQLISTKAKGSHGFGLKRIIQITEAAKGFYEICPEADHFSITIVLPLKD